MRRNPIYILAGLILLASCEGRTRTRPYLLVESGFEGNKPFVEWANDQHCCAYSVTTTAQQASAGSRALRIEVRDSDPPTSGSIRAQLVQEVDEPITERWYGFNMFLENWVTDTAGESAVEWHPDNGQRINAASLWVSGGSYVLQVDRDGTGTTSDYLDLGPVVSDRWVSWVVHVRWTVDQTGFLQVWKNDSLMVDRKGVRTCSPDGVYFKLGLDKFGWGSQPSHVSKRVVYYDEIRIGDERANYDVVKPSRK